MSRCNEVKNVILENIKNNKYYGNKLPSEEALAMEFGISAITIREALRQLHNDGYITKKHGSGNYIHKSTLDLKMRMDKTRNIADLLKDRYSKIDICQSDCIVDSINGLLHIKQGLLLKDDEKVLIYDRKFIVEDDKAVVMVRNYIPLKHLTRDVDSLLIRASILDFIWDNCNQEIVQTSVAVKPSNSNQLESEILGIPYGKALICWDELFYNLLDVPLGFSHLVFHPELVDMRLVIKW